LSLCACEDKPKNLAPAASALESAKPVDDMAAAFEVQTQDSKVTFQMDAELEKITGRAPDAISGEFFIDLKDVTKTTGLLKVDLDKLSIYQKKRDDAEGEFGEEVKNDKQNEHMRTWFEISEDAPKEVREKNRFVEFKIDKIERASAKDVTKLSGPERTVTATAHGDFRLHGRVTKKAIPVEAVFKFQGDEVTGVSLKTSEPFGVGLDEHDVRPRSAFNKLADKTLDALGAKVAKVAKVTLELSAKPKGK
jgi:hypothetical protein